MKLKCDCCGFEQDFADTEAAFDKGWDTPDRFPYTSCDLCPGSCAMGIASHEKAHEYWKKAGRPDNFDFTCMADNHWGNQDMFRAVNDPSFQKQIIQKTLKLLEESPQGVSEDIKRMAEEKIRLLEEEST